MTVLGRMERVDLRAAWQGEATDFTPWLAREENLALLGEALGMELERDREETPVGDFRADVVCRAMDFDATVLIENQLERTDHGHLGQLITYAAGLSAAQIVWIARTFREEHRAALDWLNEITPEDVGFHGVEVELWRIGDSAPAPKFNVVSRPNAWSKAVTRRIRGDGLMTRYWSAFIEGAGADLAGRTPGERDWISFSSGRPSSRLMARARARQGRLRVELYIKKSADPGLFEALQSRRQVVETAFGAPMLWEPRPQGTTASVAFERPGVDVSDESDWPAQHRWLREHVERLRSALTGPLQAVTFADAPSDNPEPAP